VPFRLASPRLAFAIPSALCFIVLDSATPAIATTPESADPKKIFMSDFSNASADPPPIFLIHIAIVNHP
jgi:hypothetical protein